jgi:hypothetical protein
MLMGREITKATVEIPLRDLFRTRSTFSKDTIFNTVNSSPSGQLLMLYNYSLPTQTLHETFSARVTLGTARNGLTRFRELKFNVKVGSDNVAASDNLIK